MSHMRLVTAAAVVLATTLSPISVAAKDGGNGNGNKPAAHAQKDHDAQRNVHGERKPVKRAKREVSTIAKSARVDALVQAPCPPGLAKRDPACIPPGQAKKKRTVVGDIVDRNDVHIITDPGLYGLGATPHGSRYAVVGNRLVRLDSRTGKILSIIRLVDAILD